MNGECKAREPVLLKEIDRLESQINIIFGILGLAAQVPDRIETPYMGTPIGGVLNEAINRLNSMHQTALEIRSAMEAISALVGVSGPSGNLSVETMRLLTLLGTERASQ
jgi:hypothetical protein